MKLPLYDDLSDNYDIIREEVEKSTQLLSPLSLTNIYSGEWEGLGIRSPWKKWMDSSDHFPILKEILASSDPPLGFVSINRLGPNSMIDWHDGKRFKSIIKTGSEKNRSSLFGHTDKNTFVMDKVKENYYAIRHHFTIYSPSADPNQLGLEVKDTGEKFAWENGECFAFCDWMTHRAWNKTNENRVAILFDTVVDYSDDR